MIVRALLVASLVVLAACSGNDSTPAESPGSDAIRRAALEGAAIQAAAESAARAYASAFIAGDSDSAFDMLSRRCRDRVSSDELAAAVAAVALSYGDATLEQVTVTLTGNNVARVSSRFDQPDLDQVDEPWVFEDGAWHNADC